MQMLIALALACAQDVDHWRALAQRHELAGRPDHAVVALARSLLEPSSEQDEVERRRELARLTQRARGLVWTQRLPSLDAGVAPSLSVAAGRVAAGGADVRVWNESNGALVAESLAVASARVVLDPTGARMAVLEPTGRESLYEVATMTKLCELSRKHGPWLLAWSGDGSRVARAVKEGERVRVCVWDAAKGALVFRSAPRGEDVLDLALSADGRLLAVVQDASADASREDGDVLVIDVDRGVVVADGLGRATSQVTFDPGRPRLMVNGDEDYGGLRAYDLVAGEWSGPRLPGLAVLGYASQDRAPVSDPTGMRWVVAGHVDVVASDAATGAARGAPLQPDDDEDRGRLRSSFYAAALSADGRWRALSGNGDSVRVWDTMTGRRLSPLAHHGAPVTTAALTTAGRLVTASADGVVRVFTLESFAPADTAVDEGAYEVHLAPRSARALVVHERGVVERISPSGESVWSFDAPTRIGPLAVSRDGSTLVGAGLSYGVWTWNANGPERALRCVSRSPSRTVAVDGAGGHVATNTLEVAYVWSTTAPALVPLAQWSFNDFDGSDLAFEATGGLLGRTEGLLELLGADASSRPGPNGDDSWCLALAERGDAELWCERDEPDTVMWRSGGRHAEKLERLLERDGRAEIREWLVSGERVVAVAEERAMLIDPSAPRVVAVLEGGGAIASARLVGDRLALELEEGPVQLFDAISGDLLAEHTLPGRVLEAQPLPGSADLVVSRTRYEVQTLDAQSSGPVGAPLKLAERPSILRAIDATTALVGTVDGALIHIELTEGAARELAPPSGNELLHVALSPDGQRVAHIEAPDVVVLRDTSSGAELYRRRLAPDSVGHELFLGGRSGMPTRSVIDFDPTGRRLLVAGHLEYWIVGGYGYHVPTRAELVDARDGAILGVLEGCEGMVSDARFSRDGERLVAWSFKRVQVWETRNGRSLADFELDHAIRDLCFQPDGRSLSIVDEDGGVSVWDLETNQARMPRQRLVAELRLTTVLAPDGTLAYSWSSEGRGQWFDLAAGEALCEAEHGPDLAFGPEGRVLVASSILGRPTEEGFVVVAIRPAERGASYWNLFADQSRVEFLDATRAVVGARLTPLGVELLFSDFGPSRLAPIAGDAAALVAEWSVKLGLRATPDGDVR